jgi:AAA domain
MDDSRTSMSTETNDQLVLIGGYSGTGKSVSLRNIRNQEKWLYLNTEAGKRLPFRNKFQNFRIDDPYQIFEAFDHGTDNKDVDGIIIDSLTFLMDMYETMYVITATNTMAAWGAYNQYFKELMQQKVVRFSKPVIITAHVRDDHDEKAMEIKTSVPIKGALKNQGIEAYFSTVVSAKKATIKDLEPYSNKLLTITEEERMLGFKHVFQTRITKNTVGERIRSPMDLFDRSETYIDNDVQILLDHLHHFYS